MSDDPNTEVRNKERFFTGTEKNADGSPVQEVVEDGKPVSEIRNKERFFTGTEKNADGSPVKEVVPTKWVGAQVPKKAKAAEPRRFSRVIFPGGSVFVRHQASESWLCFFGTASGAVGFGAFLGDSVAIQPGFRHQVEGVRGESKLVLRDGQAASVPFHGRLLVEVAKFAQWGPVAIADNHMVEDFHFEKLPGPD
jgi:hypothetical protein